MLSERKKNQTKKDKTKLLKCVSPKIPPCSSHSQHTARNLYQKCCGGAKEQPIISSKPAAEKNQDDELIQSFGQKMTPGQIKRETTTQKQCFTSTYVWLR